ncbi:MAG: hypothetical protein K9I74_10905, partial [Bacteroidales bacterium]|nr:hypothetical protein [Bacteroidales bacterium]
DYIGAGFYYDAVKAYIEHFKNVKIYLFEDLKNHPKKLLHNLFGFIGANTDFIPDRLGETYNESGSPKNNFIGSLYQQRWLKGLFKTVKNKLPENMTKKMTQSLKSRATEKPTLSRELKSELTKIYAEDIKKLENLIERDLSHWRK